MNSTGVKIYPAVLNWLFSSLDQSNGITLSAALVKYHPNLWPSPPFAALSYASLQALPCNSFYTSAPLRLVDISGSHHCQAILHSFSTANCFSLLEEPSGGLFVNCMPVHVAAQEGTKCSFSPVFKLFELHLVLC